MSITYTRTRTHEERAFEALLSGEQVMVRSLRHDKDLFQGRIDELYRSIRGNKVRVRVTERLGRVYHGDCEQIRPISE